MKQEKENKGRSNKELDLEDLKALEKRPKTKKTYVVPRNKWLQPQRASIIDANGRPMRDRVSTEYGNAFGILAPSFRKPSQGLNAIDTTLSFVDFAMYARLMQADDPGRVMYVLDVSLPYGTINGWPEELLEKERSLKTAVMSEVLEMVDVDYAFVKLEDVEELDVFKKTQEAVEASLAGLVVTPEQREAAKSVAFDNPNDAELDLRFLQYRSKRETEYTVFTWLVDGLTTKQVDIADSINFDRVFGGGYTPPIVSLKKCNDGGKYFRPKDADPTFLQPEQEFLERLKSKNFQQYAWKCYVLAEDVPPEQYSEFFKRLGRSLREARAESSFRVGDRTWSVKQAELTEAALDMKRKVVKAVEPYLKPYKLSIRGQ